MRDVDRLSRKKLNILESANTSALADRNSLHGSEYRRANLSQNPQKEYKKA